MSEPGAGTWGADGKKPKYETQGSEYPGGSGSLTVTGAAAAGGELTTAAEFAANDTVTYKYDKYSIDGIYFLNGTLKMKSGGAATGAAPGASDFTITEASTLTLSEVPATGGEAKDIAKIEFAASFVPTFVAAAATTVCGAVYDVAGTHAEVKGVTVTKAGAAGFADLEVASAKGDAAKYPEGATAGLMMALIGPRWYK